MSRRSAAGHSWWPGRRPRTGTTTACRRPAAGPAAAIPRGRRGCWPQLGAGPPPQARDDDGMPDAWEIANGLDPGDAADRNGDTDGDGYTNLEEHLNGLVAAAFPPGSPARGPAGA